MKYSILILLIMIFSCAQPPFDDTPVWSNANRYALEMSTNCNHNHDLGITGCFFKNDLSEKFLFFPKLFDSNLSFESSNCSDFNIRTSKDIITRISFEEIYDGYGENCSFKIIQKVNNIANWSFDNVIIGRLFIKVVQNNKYFSPLRMIIDDKHYDGVSWYQNKYLQSDPIVKLHPRGSNGTYEIRCGQSLIKKENFSNLPIIFNLEGLDQCDYEISVVNSDVYNIEFGTFIYEKQESTIDISNPKVYTKKDKIYFEFTDKNKEGKYSIIAVKVKDKSCIKKHKCWHDNNQYKYTVRAFTMSGRVFKKEYNLKTNSWSEL